MYHHITRLTIPILCLIVAYMFYKDYEIRYFFALAFIIFAIDSTLKIIFKEQ